MKEQVQKGLGQVRGMKNRKGEIKEKLSMVCFSEAEGKSQKGQNGENLEQNEGWKQVLSREELKGRQVKKREQMNGTVQEHH